MLDPVLDAVADLDVTVAYATTVRPFDADGLRSLEASSGAVVLVEPYLAGTSAFAVSSALAFAAAPAAEPGRPARRAAAVRDAGGPCRLARPGRGRDPAFGDRVPGFDVANALFPGGIMRPV